MISCFTDIQTKDSHTVFRWHWIAMQDKAAQHTGGIVPTILIANAISNTAKTAKMVHPDFFGEDSGRNPHHSDSENWWLQAIVAGTCNQNGKPSTPPILNLLLYL